jgi:hypothetical protein
MLLIPIGSFVTCALGSGGKEAQKTWIFLYDVIEVEVVRQNGQKIHCYVEQTSFAFLVAQFDEPMDWVHIVDLPGETKVDAVPKRHRVPYDVVPLLAY